MVLAVGQPGVAQPGAGKAGLSQSGAGQDLASACEEAIAKGDSSTVQLLQERLMTIKPAPQPLAVVLANAQVLLTCEAPDLALQVLARFSPAPGAERNLWMEMQWRAAAAGLHHGLAAQALQNLASGPITSLELRQLPLKQKEDGSWITRSALDLLASHLESLGRNREAAEVLLSGRQGGAVRAERIALAVALLEALPPQDSLPRGQKQRLLELALEQAAASGSWGLVAELLDRQLDLDAANAPTPTGNKAEGGLGRSVAMQRRLKLSGRIDDAYGEWQARRRQAPITEPAPLARADRERLAALELQLRSPRSAGGHAAALQPQNPPQTQLQSKP
ncbi:hypothetical protein [Cyanobium sp. WAJ14-Wanaka]|uniref:hypothetical protein n=1 Tax=Cyanobium sp. WAJ14-Wanaka TaxID=2823725 RepID=UPI0020CDB78C|nr:hypothetical protein [Cyanobium sp. WAJ14-Wanaka]MCP9775169.1 hypothetical protein [Cyanobium sp. WAJ14-Wanaka]